MTSPTNLPEGGTDDSWPALLVEALDSGDDQRIRLITKLFYIDMAGEGDRPRLYDSKKPPPVYRS